MSLLKDIFKLCDWTRKKECSPPPELNSTLRFSEKDATFALRILGNLAGEALRTERTLWLWEQGSTRCLAVTEAPRASNNKGTKKNG